MSRRDTSPAALDKRLGELVERAAVLIPAYNEEGSVGQVVSAIRQAYPSLTVVVVDDGSSDGTSEEASAAGARVIAHRVNMGYGAALRSAIRRCDKELLLTFDADGQHDVADIGRMLLASEDADLVVGNRVGTAGKPLARRPGKLVLQVVANFLTGRTIPDLNSGLRLFRREVILKYLHLMPSGFSFSTTSTLTFMKSSRRISWIDIEVKERQGKSTVSQLRDGPKVLMLILRLTVLLSPLRVFLPAAGTMFALSVGYFLYGFIRYGAGVADFSVMFFVGALIVFFFGLLVDQVSAMRREKHE